MKTKNRRKAAKVAAKMTHHRRELQRDHDDPVAEALRLAQNGTHRISGACADRETRPHAALSPY